MGISEEMHRISMQCIVLSVYYIVDWEDEPFSSVYAQYYSSFASTSMDYNYLYCDF